MIEFELKSPITFEGKEYKSFDLTGLEDLSGQEYKDLLAKQEKLDGETSVPERELTFAYLAAAKVTGLPADLFAALKGRDAARLRWTIGAFFLKED